MQGGMAELKDDPSIEDTETLWRNVLPWYVVRDETDGDWRVSSAAFSNDKDGDPMSVTLATRAAEIGWTPERQIDGLSGFSLAGISAGLARSCDQGVARTPRPNEPAHGVVFGQKTRSVRKRLVKGAKWILLCPPDEG